MFIRLTRRPYRKFCEMSTVGCVTKSLVADILRSGLKKSSYGVAHSLKKSSGCSSKLIVLKNCRHTCVLNKCKF